MTDIQRQPPARTPHLIHIGYPKSGSSFLRHWFAAHGEIAYRPGHIAGLSRFANIGGKAHGIKLRVTSSETFSSPETPGETLNPGAYRAAQTAVCESLADVFPTAHVLIVTRGYRSMIMSSYSQYVRAGGSKSLQGMLCNSTEQGSWDYDGVVGMYRRHFGADKVMVLPWELLRDAPDEFVGRIEAGFGLRHHPPSPQRVNTSLTPVEMHWYAKFSSAIAKAPVGPRLRASMARSMALWSHRNRLAAAIRLLQRIAPAPPVSLDLLPSATLEAFRGQASCLAAEPAFAPYARDYLNDRLS